MHAYSHLLCPSGGWVGYARMGHAAQTPKPMTPLKTSLRFLRQKPYICIHIYIYIYRFSIFGTLDPLGCASYTKLCGVLFRHLSGFGRIGRLCVGKPHTCKTERDSARVKVVRLDLQNAQHNGTVSQNKSIGRRYCLYSLFWDMGRYFGHFGGPGTPLAGSQCGGIVPVMHPSNVFQWGLAALDHCIWCILNTGSWGLPVLPAVVSTGIHSPTLPPLLQEPQASDSTQCDG